ASTAAPSKRANQKMMKLAKYDAMVRAIAIAYKVDEVKEIRDQAAALEKYSKLAKDVENERRCCEIRLRAERKAGLLIKKMPKAKGGGAQKSKDKNQRCPWGTGDTLKAKGISRKQAEQWQKPAAPTDEQFESAIQQADMPTTKGIIKATQPPKEKPVAPKALWLW